MTIAIQINTNNMGREKEGTDSGLPYGGGLACGPLYGQLLGNQRPDFMDSLMGGRRGEEISDCWVCCCHGDNRCGRKYVTEFTRSQNF